MPILKFLEPIRTWTAAHRKLLLGGAGILFVAGLIWSVVKLDIDVSQIDAAAMGCAIVLSAMSVAINVFELQLCGRAAQVRMGFKSAAAFSSWATVANVLPIPASILIRGGALRAAGTGWGQAGKIILAAGVMWLTMALVVSSYALLPHWSGLVLMVASICATFGLSAWIWRKSDGATATGFVTVRAALLAMLILRLWLIFQAIDRAIPLDEVSAFALAGIIGNAVAIVPAGIGITEAFGALIATALEYSPEAAFMALALNRILGLALSGAVAMSLGASARAMPEKALV